jgi:hypothetical protein
MAAKRYPLLLYSAAVPYLYKNKYGIAKGDNDAILGGYQ